jgi:polysaccharide export outer membrane protein
MALLRYSLLVLAASFLSACGASSMSELNGDMQRLGNVAPEPAGKASSTPDARKDSDAVPRDQEAAVQKAALSLSSVSDPNSKAYKIGPRDVLEVTVFKVPDLSKVVQVSESGAFSFPLVGEVRAGGRTSREVEQDLTKLLGAKYLQNPQVGVFVKEYNSQRITVEGAVKKPGVYPIVGGMTLVQAIATAGGFEDKADETILLVRQTDGKSSGGRFDVANIRQGKERDVQLEPGDVIVAPTSNVKQGMEMLMRLAPLANIAPLL